MALKEDSFASTIQQSIDVLDNEIESAIEDIISPNSAASAEYSANMKTSDSDCKDNISPVEPVVSDHVELF